MAVTAVAGRTGMGLAEQQVAGAIDQSDDTCRPDAYGLVKTAQPLGLEGRREKAGEAPLAVAQGAADRNAHAADMLGRPGGADDQRAARLLPQPPVQKEAPPRCAGDGRVGRGDHETVGIENVESTPTRESGART